MMLLVFCLMVHGGAAIKSDKVVNDILDSTTFNVAMFAMGWALTNWIKGGSSQPLWIKHWSRLLLSTPFVAFGMSGSAIAGASPKCSRVKDDESEDQATEVPSPLSPLSELSKDDDAFEQLSLEGEDSSPLVAAAGAWILAKLQRPQSTSVRCEMPPWHRLRLARAVFEEEQEISSTEVEDFIAHIYWYFECSSPCLVLAMIYLDRAAASDNTLVLDTLNCRRLLLTALVLALKFHDDDYAPYPNSVYADMGGVSVEDLKVMEKKFCKLLDWKFHVDSEEYARYHQLLMPEA